MPYFSNKSETSLKSCDERIQKVFYEVIKSYDCTIVWGHRGKEAQNEAYRMGYSKAKWGESLHNSYPSKAVDVVPYPKGFRANREEFILFAGYVLGIAEQLGVKLRWGGDWDKDFNPKNTSFFDGAHFELVE